MLVDHHCHLDFPEFAPELDQVVARAHQAGVGTLVTISTRIRQFDKVRAVAERFHQLLGAMGRVDDEIRKARAGESLDLPDDQRLAAGFEQRFRRRVRQRAHSLAATRRQDHRATRRIGHRARQVRPATPGVASSSASSSADSASNSR